MLILLLRRSLLQILYHHIYSIVNLLSIIVVTAAAADICPQKPPKAEQKVKTKVKTVGGGGQQSSSDDDAQDVTDDSVDGLGDIESRLSKLQRMRSTVTGAEAASLEREIKRVSKLLDDLADMKPDEQLDAIQAEKRRVQIMERINAIGKCPVGFEWIWRPGQNSFQCAGGSHWASAADLQMTDADKRLFEQKK